MAVTTTILFLMALPTLSLADKRAPLLLWKFNVSGVPLPDFHELSSTEEESKLHELLNSLDAKTVILFLMDELSVEDFSWYTDALYRLQREFESSEHVFTPSLPSLAVGRLTSYSIITVNISNPSEVRLAEDASKTLLLVPLRDRQAFNRRTTLRQADNIIGEVLDSVKRLAGSYVAVLTGRYTNMSGDVKARPSRSLKALVSGKPSEQKHLFLNLGCVLFYTSGFPVIHFQSVKETADQQALLLPLGAPTSKTSNCNGSEVNTVTIVWQHTNSTSVNLAGVTLRLTFKARMSRPGGSDLSSWTLGNVTLSYKGTVDGKAIGDSRVALDFDDVYAPRHFSYHCTNRLWAAEPTMSATDGDGPMLTALQLPGFQVQAFLPAGAPARFGRPWDCTTLFTIPILSGLLLALLMLAILAVSLAMLADIRPADRFDDPRGPLLLAHLNSNE